MYLTTTVHAALRTCNVYTSQLNLRSCLMFGSRWSHHFQYCVDVRVLLEMQRLICVSSKSSSVIEPAASNTLDRKHVQKGKLQVTTPQLTGNILSTMKNAVGIHIGMNCISWAMLGRNGSLLEWDLLDLESGTKKVHPTKLYEQVMEIKQQLPVGDVFVLEDKSTGSHQTQQQQASFLLTTHQLSAMLLVLLNIDSAQTGVVLSQFEHKVYFLRSRLSARLFRTIVGSECVSAQSVVQDILFPQSSRPHFSAVSVPDRLQEGYLHSNKVQQENLCRALLLVMAFMELAVHKNPHALNFVNTRLK